MKGLGIVLVLVLTLPVMAWSDEDQSAPPGKGRVRIDDLPKPIPELLEKIQQLSQKIEPEITKLGSRLGHELSATVKKLCDELQCQESRESAGNRH